MHRFNCDQSKQPKIYKNRQHFDFNPFYVSSCCESYEINVEYMCVCVHCAMQLQPKIHPLVQLAVVLCPLCIASETCVIKRVSEQQQQKPKWIQQIKSVKEQKKRGHWKRNQNERERERGRERNVNRIKERNQYFLYGQSTLRSPIDLDIIKWVRKFYVPQEILFPFATLSPTLPPLHPH